MLNARRTRSDGTATLHGLASVRKSLGHWIHLVRRCDERVFFGTQSAAISTSVGYDPPAYISDVFVDENVNEKNSVNIKSEFVVTHDALFHEILAPYNENNKKIS